ncbi:MAG: DUF4186 domain-containing protein [Bacilli bacterium]
MNQNIDKILLKLTTSKFRSSFHLKEKDLIYIEQKGLQKIESHAYDFINKRLRDITNINDGKQTPIKGHPVFVAQHATATCCRGCLEKWHHIPKDRLLSDEKVKYIVNVIMSWINQFISNNKNAK